MRWLGQTRFLSVTESHESPPLTDIVQRLNTHIGLPLRAEIVCADMPNAFAVPGGTILVTSGLLRVTRSENGLAFVLGHEIGHFVHRDHLRGLGRSLLIALGASLMGVDAGILGTPGIVGSLLDQRFSQSDEASADRFALDLIIALYGHAWGAEELFQHLSSTESEGEKLFSRFAGQHPPTQDRLDTVRAHQSGKPEALVIPQMPFERWIAAAGCTASTAGLHPAGLTYSRGCLEETP